MERKPVNSGEMGEILTDEEKIREEKQEVLAKEDEKGKRGKKESKKHGKEKA